MEHNSTVKVDLGRLMIFKKISEWIHQITTVWVMLISLVIMVLFMIFVLPNQAKSSLTETGSSQSPDTTFFYTPGELYQIAIDYGEDGRQAYVVTRWTFDLIYPLVYTGFLVFGISWFTQKLTNWPDRWKLGNLIPLLAGIFDFLENSMTSLVMILFPTRIEGVLILATTFTPIKWILVSGSFILYFIVGTAALFGWINSRKNS